MHSKRKILIPSPGCLQSSSRTFRDVFEVLNSLQRAAGRTVFHWDDMISYETITGKIREEAS